MPPIDQQDLHRVLVSAAPDALVAIDVDSRLLLWNPAAERMFGYSADEMMGRSLSTVIPERYRHGHAAGVARYLATGKRQLDWRAVPAVGMRVTGDEFPMSITFAETEYDGNRAFLGFIRDLSSEAAAAKALREAQQLRETLLASIGEGLSDSMTNGVSSSRTPRPPPYWAPTCLTLSAPTFML